MGKLLHEQFGLHLLDALYLRCNIAMMVTWLLLQMLHLLDALYLRCNRDIVVIQFRRAVASTRCTLSAM